MELFENFPIEIVLKIIEFLPLQDLYTIIKSFPKFNELYCYYIYDAKLSDSLVFNPLMFPNRNSIDSNDVEFVEIPIVPIVIIEIDKDCFINLSNDLKYKNQKRILVDLIDLPILQSYQIDNFINISSNTFNILTKLDEYSLLGIQHLKLNNNLQFNPNNFYFTSNDNDGFNYNIQRGTSQMSFKPILNVLKNWNHGQFIDSNTLRMDISFKYNFNLNELINFQKSPLKFLKFEFNDDSTQIDRIDDIIYKGSINNDNLYPRLSKYVPILKIVDILSKTLNELDISINVGITDVLIDGLNLPNLRNFKLSFRSIKSKLTIGLIKAINLENFEIELIINDFDMIDVNENNITPFEFGNIKTMIIKPPQFKGINSNLKKNNGIQTKLIELMNKCETLKVYGSFPFYFDKKTSLNLKNLEFLDWIYNKSYLEIERPNEELSISKIESFKLKMASIRRTHIEEYFDSMKELPIPIERIFPFNLDSLKTVSIIASLYNQDKSLFLKVKGPMKRLECLNLDNVVLKEEESGSKATLAIHHDFQVSVTSLHTNLLFHILVLFIVLLVLGLTENMRMLFIVPSVN